MANENKKLDIGNLDDVLEKTVGDVVPPSPVADMPQASVASAGAAVGNAGLQPEAPAPAAQAKKRGRPPKEKPLEGMQRPIIKGAPIAQNPVNIDTAGIEPCAELGVMLVNASGMALGGELAAMQQVEAKLAKDGFVSYFKAKGVHNVPAWVVLAGSLAPYYMRVLTQTPAKTTVSTIFGRISLRAKEIWKAKKNARFNSGNNVKRENDLSEKTSDKSAQ